MGDAAGARCLTGHLPLTKEKRNNHIRYVKPDTDSLEGIMEAIKNNWKIILFVLLVFGLFGLASGLINWGILILVALVFGAIKGKDAFAGWMNSDEEEVEYDPFS
jgi:hypothetical protein